MGAQGIIEEKREDILRLASAYGAYNVRVFGPLLVVRILIRATGLVLSTLLTLIVIPVVFTIVDDMWKAFLRKFFPGAYKKSITEQGSPEPEPVLADV